MSDLQAFWLGIVQGLTEFLPVSSSGHLVIFQQLLGVQPEGGLVLEIVVHLATMVAIALFYWRRIFALIQGAVKGDADTWRYIGKLGVGTLPAVGVGLFLKDFIEQQFANPALVGVALIVTGFVLWTTRTTSKTATLEEPSWKAALLIGCAQAFAILPGISRSGSTVSAALALGIAPAAAAEFSFLLGIIAIAGAAVLMLPDLGQSSPEMMSVLSVAAVAALVSGIAAIWSFVWLLRKQAFHYFSFYVWAAGAGFLVWLAVQ